MRGIIIRKREKKENWLQQIRCNVLLQYFITCVNLLDFMMYIKRYNNVKRKFVTLQSGNHLLWTFWDLKWSRTHQHVNISWFVIKFSIQNAEKVNFTIWHPTRPFLRDGSHIYIYISSRSPKHITLSILYFKGLQVKTSKCWKCVFLIKQSRNRSLMKCHHDT